MVATKFKIGYFTFVVVVGLTVSIPIVLTLLTGGSQLGSVYDRFGDEQRPLFFRLHPPTIVTTVTAVFTALILWPMLGLLISLVTRPTSLRHSIWVGTATSVLCSGLFYALLGWLVIILGSVQQTEHAIISMANVIWQPEGLEASDALNEANAIYDGLDKIPAEERAKIVASRLIADQFAMGPISIGIAALVCVFLSIPVVMGTVISYVLLQRKTHFIWIVIRYGVAWWSITSGTLLIFAFFAGGTFNNRPASESPLFIGTIVLVCGLLAWICLRRWKKDGVEVTGRSTKIDSK